MAVQWNDLSTKQDNYDGSKGKLTASEWNDFVVAVKSHDDSIKTLSAEQIKGVYINGTTYTVHDNLDKDGVLQVGTLTSNRSVSFTFDGYPNGKLPQTPITIASDTKSLKFKFTINDKKSNGESFTTVLGSSLTYTIVNTTNNSVHHIYTQQNSVCDGSVVEFDFMQYGKSILSNEGSYSLSITYANNGGTDSASVNCDVVNLNVSFDPEFTDIYTATGNSNNFPIVVARVGAVLHCSINDKTLDDIVFTDSDAIKLYDTIIANSVDGTNNFKLYVSYEKNGVPIKSNEYAFRYLYIKSDNQSKITSTITNGSVFKVYENMVVDYILYSSSTESSVKVVAQLYIDDTPVDFIAPIENTVAINDGIGRDTVVFSLMPKGEISADDIAKINKIKISCDALFVSDTIDIVIEKQDVPFKEVTDNLIAYFDADGKTMDVKEWSSNKVVDGVTHKYEFDLSQLEFIPGSSGWYTDVTDGSSLKIKRGKRATLNYKPFKKEVCYTGTSNNDGLTISIEFKTSKCFDDNAPVISCINSEESGNDRGFVINTSNMLLSGSTKSLTTKFNENSRLRVDFVIDGKTNTYKYTSYDAKDAANGDYKQVAVRDQESKEALMLIYIDGVYAGFREFSNDKLAFIQSTPQDITFGSDYCDLDIYKIRIYNTALSVPQILSNVAFDANGFENKCAIANRNNIFDGESFRITSNKPNIDRAKLEKALPNLPVFTVELTDEYNKGDAPGELTNTKEVWQKTTISKYYDLNKMSTNVTVPLTSWETKHERSQIRNQGTSSMGYPWPWRNWDWKTKEYFVPTINGTETSKWLQYDVNHGWDSDAISTFGLQKLTFKKDYASSEMCNNAICSELFTDFAMLLAPIKNEKGDYKYIGTDEDAVDSILSKPMKDQFISHGGTDYRFSLKAKPCFMYQKLSYSVDGNPENKEGSAGKGYDAMGMMNLIPNKNEVGYLGFTNNKWEDNVWSPDGIESPKEGETELNKSLEQSWELTENKSDVYWKKPFPPASVDANGFYVKDIVEAYEARTPKDSPIFLEDNGFAEDKDFGHAPKDVKLTEKQLEALDGQTEKIRRFHNWLVQVDRGTCTGLTLRELELEMEGKYYYIDTITNLQAKYPEYADVNDAEQIDDAAWRLRRFQTEYKHYIIKNQWLMYYLWREMLWMFDSGFKNLQVYTLDGDHWGCMVRDADTALGIENTGKDYFPPHLEDTDLYRIENGKILFAYNAADNMYNVDEAHGINHNEVLNGQFGSIWLNIRDSFGTELQNMYKDLKTKGVTAKYLIDAFRNHQENWCEALYNFGLRQYCFGASFTKYYESALGDKKHQRAQWITRGKYYRDTKYNAYDGGDIAKGRFKAQSVYRKDGNNYIPVDVPTNENGKLINITTYIPCYLGMGGTDAAVTSIANKFRVVDVNNDKNYNINVPIGEGGLGIGSSDANWYLWGVEYITEFKDLYKYVGLGTENLNELKFPRLRKLELGHESDRDGIEYFTLLKNNKDEEQGGQYIPLLSNASPISMACDKLEALSCLDLTNWTNLESLLDINKCSQLEEIYVRRTGLQSINLPSTSTLHTVYLGDKLSNLTMENLTGIKKFVIGNDAENAGVSPKITANAIADLYNVTITNCNEYMQKKSEELVNVAITVNDKTNTVASKLKSVNLTGINWGNDETVGPFSHKRLNYLLDITNTLEGVINIDNMSTELKLRLVESKGNVDNVNNPLYVTYTNETPIYNAKFKYEAYWLEPSNEMLDMGSQLVFNYGDWSSFANPNTMNSIKWSLEGVSEEYVKINPNTGIVTRVDPEYTVDDPIKVVCTITQKPDPNNGAVKEVVEVKGDLFLNKHVAKPGDVVYPDGSFSNKYIAEDNPIGICFYVDEENPDNRLMFATRFISGSNGYSWGLGHYYSGSPNAVQQSPIVQNTPPGDNAIYKNVESGDPTLYDINGVINYSSLIENMGDTPLTQTENYVYQQNGVNYFKKYVNTYAVSELGFKTIDKDMQTYVSYDSFISNPTDGKTMIAKKDSIVPVGLYNTVKIINTRNAALTYPGLGIGNYIGGINNIIPFSSETKSERDMLLENIGSIQNIKLNGVENDPDLGSMDFYYPAASFAWAYNPCNVNSSITNIDSKFTEHNWFLPAAGDGLRIAYYINAVVNNSFNNLSEGFEHFANDTVTKSLFNNLGSAFHTSTEWIYNSLENRIKTVKMGVGVRGESGTTTTQYTIFKSEIAPYVLPICRF